MTDRRRPLPTETLKPPPDDSKAVTPYKTGAGLAWFEIALVFLVFLVAGGDPAPHRNEAHYLCRLKHFWDPGWCAGDLFLESPDAHFTVVWLFGWVTRFVSLETTAWIGRGLSWALLAWGWRRLSWRVAPWPLLAPLGAALLVVATEQLHFAGEWVVGGFEAKTLAYGFVLLALRDAIDNRWNRAWVLLGVASALHALVGGWSVLALGFAWLVCRRRPPLVAMAPGLVAGGLLSLAGVWPALALNLDAPREAVTQANQVYVFERLPHHLSLLTMPTEWLANRAMRHAVMLIGLALLHRACLRRAGQREALGLIVWYAWGAALLGAVGLAIELVGWNDPAWAASLLRYYLFRLSDIAAPIAAVLLIASWLSERLATESKNARLAAALLASLAVWHLGGYAAARLEQPAAPADSKMSDPAAWVEMCRWIETHTEPDALFLVPRQSSTFKWRAGRAEVVTYKDVPQDALSMIEWRRRYRDIFQTGVWQSNGRPRWTPSLAALGAAKLRELAERYGARYALNQARRDGFRKRRASLPVVHEVGPYTLYDLRPPD